MTLEDAKSLAIDLLREKGQLLNAQLLRLVDSDELLMQEVRESLIFDDQAVDKNGVGLRAIIRKPTAPEVDPVSVNQATSSPASNENDAPRSPETSLCPDRIASVGTTPTRWAEHELKSLCELTRNGLHSQKGLTNSQEIESGVAPDDTTVADSNACSLGFSAKLQHGTPAATSQELELDGMRHDSTGKVQRFFLWNAGREEGPLVREELEKRVAEKQLALTDFVKQEGDDEWIPISEAIRRVEHCSERKWNRTRKAPRDEEAAGLPGHSGPSSNTASANDDVAAIAPIAGEPLPQADKTASSNHEKAKSAAAPALAEKKQSRSRPSVRALAEIQSSPIVAGWRKCEQHLGAMRLRRAAALLVVGLAAWIYWTWPPAPDTIYVSFMRCRIEMDGLQDKNGPPEEWAKFAAVQRPRIERLVSTLQRRASANRPADQELLWAGEKCLLSILQKGPGATAGLNQLFSTHMRNARRILDGEPPAVEVASTDATSTGGSVGSPAVYSPLPTGMIPPLGISSANTTSASEPAVSKSK